VLLGALFGNAGKLRPRCVQLHPGGGDARFKFADALGVRALARGGALQFNCGFAGAALRLLAFAIQFVTAFGQRVLAGLLLLNLHSRCVDALGEGGDLLLQAGLSLLLFPEGSRSRDGHPQAFKPIASMLAADTGVPLIPVTVRGTFASLPAGRWLPRRRPIRVAFAHPIVPSEETGAVTGSFHARIRRIQLMLETAIAQGEGDGQ